jgi:hypothetical protein
MAGVIEDEAAPRIARDELGKARAEIPLIWVFLLTAIVTVTSLALAVYATLRPSPLQSHQYRFTVAMICFSLSTLAGLLFASKAELRASVGLLSATIVGQAALWLVSIAVFNFVFPETRIADLDLVKRVLEGAGKLDNSWRSFDQWKGELEEFRRVFEDEEESNTKHLLNAAAIRGAGMEKASDATLETLFVFPPPSGASRHTVKFQRIAIRNRQRRGMSVYLTASPTSVAGEANGFFFVRRDQKITSALELKEQARWEKVEQNDIEGMLVALYKDKADLEGDWLQVHTPKYVMPDATAQVRLGLVSTSPVEALSPKLWEMRLAPWPDPASIPLIFHQRGEEMDRDFERWTSEFGEWLDVLEQASQKDATDEKTAARKAFLLRVREHLAGAAGFSSWKDVLRGGCYANRVSFSARRVEDPVVLTFLWGASTDAVPAAPPQRTAMGR